MEKSNAKKVGKKWFISLMIFLWGCIVLCGYIVYSILNINKYNELSNQIDNILISSQKSTVAAKEFLINAYTDESFVLKGTNENYEDFNKSIDTIKILTETFSNSEFMSDEDRKVLLPLLDSSFNSYKLNFYKIAELFKQKGFKDLGLEGEMRKAVHFIEKNESPIDLEFLLTLRRHEKDFLLRKDYSYKGKFDTDLVKFEVHIINNEKIMPTSNKEAVLKALEDYKNIFGKIVDIEMQIGLNAKEGLRHNFTTSLKKTEEILSTLNKEIKEEKRKASYAINVIIGSIIMVFILIISLVFFSINYLNSSILDPIFKLNEGADQVANGNLSVNLDGLRNNELMRDLVLSFEKLIVKFRDTIQQIELISARKISQTFELSNDKDEIGKSLNKIISELKEIDTLEKSRIWASEGISKFGEIVRGSQNLNSLADDSIKFLVKYLSANQGALFIVNSNENIERLKLISAYAYERKKHINKEIEIGEGLLGQCYKEKDIVYLTEIPNDYLSITSGLGYANPKCILIVPMIFNEKVEAIIELASFKKFEKHHLDFVAKIGEIMASSIASVNTKELTELLLKESKLQSENIEMHDQEMKQNLKELMDFQTNAIQDEKFYLSEIEQLKYSNGNNIAQIEQLKKEQVNLNIKVKATEIENRKLLEQLHLPQNSKKQTAKYPRRIEHFLES